MTMINVFYHPMQTHTSLLFKKNYATNQATWNESLMVHKKKEVFTPAKCITIIEQLASLLFKKNQATNQAICIVMTH